VGFNVVLAFPLMGWLPQAAFIEIGYPAEDIPHLLHGVGIGIGYGALLLSLAVQLRRPQRWVAPLWLGIFLLGAQSVFDLVRWDIDHPIWFIAYGLFIAVVALHPQRATRVTSVGRPALLLAAVGAVPLAVYAWQQLQLQFGPEDAFGHVADNHFYGMAAASGVIIVAALLGSTDLPGGRLTAWIASAGAVLFGLASVAHPNHASAWPPGWAVAAVAWGVAYVLVGEVRQWRRRLASLPLRQLASARLPIGRPGRPARR
jgi:hypothetical protein